MALTHFMDSVKHKLNINMNLNLNLKLIHNLSLKLNLNRGSAQYSTSEKFLGQVLPSDQEVETEQHPALQNCKIRVGNLPSQSQEADDASGHAVSIWTPVYDFPGP